MKKHNMNRTAGLVLLAATASMNVLPGFSPYMVSATGLESPAKNTTITTAASQGTLTIRKTDTAAVPQPVGGAVYTAYKLMSLTPAKAPGEYASYEIMTHYKAFFEQKGIKADSLGNYPAAKLEALIHELEILAKTDTGIVSQGTDSANGTTSLTLPLGWYLIVETASPEGMIAAAPFLAAIPSTNNITVPGAPPTAGTEWIYDISASPKAPRITVDKKIVNAQLEHDSSFVEAGTFLTEKGDTAGLNDFVKYSVTVSVPSYGPSYFHKGGTPVFMIQDTMSNGLTIQNEQEHPVEIKIGGQIVPETVEGKKNYSIAATPKETDEEDLKISFTNDFLQNAAYRGKEMIVTYYAKLNEKAVMGTAGNTNNVVLSFDNKPGHTITASPEKDDPTVVPDCHVYTYGIEVEKGSEAFEKALQGAEFKLFKDQAMTKAVPGSDGREIQTTDAAGMLLFPRLDAGTYYLKEVKSPLGYSLLMNPIKIEIVSVKGPDGKITNGEFTLKVDGKEVTQKSGSHVTRLSAAEGIATIAIENHRGFSLPATGGPGILIFVAVSVLGMVTVTVSMLRSDKKKG